jgi:hypothetical protein
MDEKKDTYCEQAVEPQRDFGFALYHLKRGRKVSREGWNGKGMWLKLQHPDTFSKMQRPYVYIKTANNELVPWVASHGDLLGNDWRVEHE